jgi:predicted DsbA family dithiol-disulfide isomerase
MKITIEVFADTLCPFCYIGKRNLEKATAEFRNEVPETEFETIWRPFLSWPDIGGQGKSLTKKPPSFPFQTQKENSNTNGEQSL